MKSSSKAPEKHSALASIALRIPGFGELDFFRFLLNVTARFVVASVTPDSLLASQIHWTAQAHGLPFADRSAKHS